MSNLPVEISKNILYHLDTPDLKQCQLTGQYWHTPATELLYHFVRLEQRYQLDLFMQAVKNEPSLGLLVKKIHIHFSKYESSVKDHHFIDFVINFCPNLVFISIPHHDPPHYVQLINAGYLGKLKYLEEIALPIKRSDTLKYYNCATLAFSKSIKTLELRDTIELTRDSRFRLFTDDFIWLRDELHHFTKLEKLSVVHHSNEGLIGINDIIDTCHTLKHLITTFVTSDPVESEDTPLNIPSIQPSLHIKIFEGHYTVLDHQDSVKYLMCKFPKLQKLKLTNQSFDFFGKSIYERTYGDQEFKLTAEVAREFLYYLSRIPSVTVEFNLNGVDVDTLIDVMLRNGNRFNNTITLQYDVCGTDVYFQDRKNTFIRFPSRASSSTSDLCDKLFIEKSGCHIRYLSVFCYDVQNSLLGDMKVWLDHVVQYCPNLKELEIETYTNMRLDPRKVNGLTLSTLEKLTTHGSATTVLPYLCALFPRLNYLRIYSNDRSPKARSSNSFPFLNIPSISLDKLVCIYRDYGYATNYQYHIRVATDSGTFYYVADVEGAEPSTVENFKMAFKKAEPVLNIKCRKLVDLHITHMNLPEKINHLNV